MASVPQKSSWGRSGGGPMSRARRMSDQVSQGGPPPERATLRARMCSFQTSKVWGRIVFPRTGSMAMSMDRAVTVKSTS
eukprot:432529-Pyramimonas_sp.AAC.1